MEFVSPSRVFLTGATGLVGGHVTEALLKAYPGVQVTTIVQSMDPRSYLVQQGLDKRIGIYYGDIRDRKLVNDLVMREEIDTIIHLAAQPLVSVALQLPYETCETNFMGTLNVLEAARHSPNIRAIVLASTDKSYGRAVFQPYTEEHPLNALHPYDSSKAAADILARCYAQCYGMPIVVTRFGNIYGPGDLNFNRLIPGAMSALNSDVPLRLRSDGSMRRDFVYVKDVAEGYLLLAKNAKEHAGEAFNITSNVNMSVLEALERISSVVGKQVPFVIENTAKHEIPAQALSNEKIQSRLGWQPPHTFEDGIRETHEWYKKYGS